MKSEMMHKHLGSNDCTCGYHGLHYGAVGSHIGYHNRGLSCDVTGKHKLYYYGLDGNWIYCIDCGLLEKK